MVIIHVLLLNLEFFIHNMHILGKAASTFKDLRMPDFGGKKTYYCYNDKLEI